MRRDTDEGQKIDGRLGDLSKVKQNSKFSL